jgi:K+-sensing histidine kinase KdpD
VDESSARRRDLYLTIHNTLKRQTSMLQARFVPTIPGSERPQTHALDRAATGIDIYVALITHIYVALCTYICVELVIYICLAVGVYIGVIVGIFAAAVIGVAVVTYSTFLYKYISMFVFR